MSTTAQSDVGLLRRIVLKHARDAFGSEGRVSDQWRALHYVAPPNFEVACAEYDAFADVFYGLSVDIEWMPADAGGGLDSIYVRDASVVCNRGVVLCNMGKPARRPEPDAFASVASGWGIEVLGQIDGEGHVEGGDVVWLDERTIAVGEGYRTNAEGIRQLKVLLGDAVDEILTVPLPHWRGADDVFHLMSILSPIDADLALVYSRLLPVPFRNALLERGIQLVDVPDDEFDTMGCNVLALAPRRCLMLDGNTVTRNRLETAQAEVATYKGDEISRQGAGGPTCLTRPLVRDAMGD